LSQISAVKSQQSKRAIQSHRVTEIAPESTDLMDICSYSPKHGSCTESLLDSPVHCPTSVIETTTVVEEVTSLDATSDEEDLIDLDASSIESVPN
jgi:hypothetical protein